MQRAILFCGLWLALCAAPTAALLIVDPGQGPVRLSGTSGGGLSGITHRSGNQFFSVSDSGGRMYDTRIDIDRATGLIEPQPSLGEPITLNGGVDLEGIAYDPVTDTVLVSDENGPAVRRHGLAGGPGIELVVPVVFANARANRSLESLSLQPGSGALWTANEEALDGDGPVSTTTGGTAVRITNLTSSRQWAYITDPIRPLLANRSGVADLAVLPDGRLLVLEREFSFGFRHRIYEVDVAGATEISALAMLDSNRNNDLSDESWLPLAKGSPLWEYTTLLANFEGMSLGPRLDNGEMTLVLVSDDDRPATQDLYMLHLHGQIPEPSTLAALALGATGLVGRRFRSPWPC